MFISVGYISRVDFLDHKVDTCLTKIILFYIFHKVCCQPLITSVLQFWTYSDEHVTVSHCGFNLHSLLPNDVECLFMYFLAVQVYLALPRAY